MATPVIVIVIGVGKWAERNIGGTGLVTSTGSMVPFVMSIPAAKNDFEIKVISPLIPATICRVVHGPTLVRGRTNVVNAPKELFKSVGLCK